VDGAIGIVAVSIALRVPVSVVVAGVTGQIFTVAVLVEAVPTDLSRRRSGGSGTLRIVSSYIALIDSVGLALTYTSAAKVTQVGEILVD
jgi:hypothetical protein